ncbi:hypothetical protein CC78DRAFT_577662 [Lojkania enalia]|uniref:Amino acid permease/ SLC12A domain-containing protein n=1 Tax=Lojkania enalia TaxID=147567 RepID=A0A9P4KFQ4_9PLEO|nr:hypothetical protein CC78DRAFT_577662 [Didymosphaeria enalia]
MASTGVDYNGSNDFKEKEIAVTPEKPDYGYDVEGRHPSLVGSVQVVSDSTHRKLKPRHIQLIGIGGTIGTALYVQIGHGLLNGGPGSLFLAFTICPITTPIATPGATNHPTEMSLTSET